MTNRTPTLLVDSDLVESIEITLLRRGISRSELPDAVAEVQVRAVAAGARGKSETCLARLRALCTRIARDYAIDESRKRTARARYDVGLCDDPDAHAVEAESDGGRDASERKRLVDLLHDLVVGGELPEHAMAILRAEADGVLHRVSGQDLGITDRAVECRLAVIRARFEERLKEAGMSDFATWKRRVSPGR